MSRDKDLEVNLAAMADQLKRLQLEVDALEQGGECEVGVAEALATRRSGDDSYQCLTGKNQRYLLLNNVEKIKLDDLLSDLDRRRLDDEYFAPIRCMRSWDRWDYVTVGVAGLTAGLLDVLLVRQPKAASHLGVRRRGSPLTSAIRDRSVSSSNPLADFCRNTSYDSFAIDGMSPRDHRLKSFGHDPALGWILGIVDILSGSVTGVDKAQNIVRIHGVAPNEASILVALIKHGAHLLSDVHTKCGLPPPFFTLLHAIKVGSFGQEGRNVGEIIRWMYLNGYDLRHFFVQGLCGPAMVELIVRTIVYLRVRLEDGYHDIHYTDIEVGAKGLFHDPKYRSMLFWGHAIASLCNAGKVALQQGNPLAINYAQWLALFRHLIPRMKEWLASKSDLRLSRLFESVNKDWEALLLASDLAVKRLQELEAGPVLVRS